MEQQTTRDLFLKFVSRMVDVHRSLIISSICGLAALLATASAGSADSATFFSYAGCNAPLSSAVWDDSGKGTTTWIIAPSRSEWTSIDFGFQSVNAVDFWVLDNANSETLSANFPINPGCWDLDHHVSLGHSSGQTLTAVPAPAPAAGGGLPGLMFGGGVVLLGFLGWLRNRALAAA